MDWCRLLEALAGTAIVVVPLFVLVGWIDKNWHKAQSGGL